MDSCLIPGLPEDVAEECLIRVAFHRLLVLRFVCQRWKQMVFSPHFHRRRRLAGKTTSLLVVSHHCPIKTGKYAGQDHLILFDPKSGTYHPLHHIPIPPPGQNSITHFNTIVGVGHSLVVISTVDQDENVQIYNFLTGSWRKGASMPGPSRHGFACTTDGHRRILISGGYSKDSHASIGSSILSYDIEEDIWESHPEIVDGCKSIFRSVFHDSILYAFSPDKTGSYTNMYWMDLFISSDWQWKGPQSLQCMKTCWFPDTFTIAEGGKLYFSWNDKLWVKDGERVRVLLDLPLEIEGDTTLTTWNGNLLVTGYPLGSNQLFGVYTLDLKGANQELSWRPYMMTMGEPKVGFTEMKTWLEI